MKRAVTASTDKTAFKKLSKDAENIADMISEFLDATSRMNDIGDFLDEYDLENIGKAMDALYDAAQSFANEVRYS